MPSRPLPLIDPRELARRNNESAANTPGRLRTKSRRLDKTLSDLTMPLRPLRAIGFFHPEHKVGFHDHRP